MSSRPETAPGMTLEEKRAWAMLLVTPGAFLTYVGVLLSRAGGGPIHQVPYAPTLLWTLGLAALVSLAVYVGVALVSPGECERDERDRVIHRFAEYAGHSFVVMGAVAALGMALAEVPHFWIANVVYLSFALSCLLTSAAKIAAYRRGIPDC